MTLNAKQEKYLKLYHEKYGNKYTYAPETIVNSYTKMPISCDCGNVFHMSPYNHTRYGCPECGVKRSTESRTYSQEQYLGKLIAVHGNKFDLSRFAYEGSKNKITLGCKVEDHGFFEISPVEALRGHGCSKCAGTYQMTNDEYVEALKAVHSDRYDLSLVDFKGTRVRVTGVCKEHGEFTLRADNFLNGGNCPKCARIIATEKTKLTQDEVIAKFKDVHGNRYDYSQFIYLGSTVKGTIICREHGPFLMTSSGHLMGNNCSECGRIATARANEKPIEDLFTSFVERARKKHGDKYTYHISDFVGRKDKVRITCKIHGDFWQDLSSHVHARAGCPTCNESKGEKAVAAILDKYSIAYKRQYKMPNTVYKFRYDFYLTECNILVEFHGVQHYKPCDYFNGIEGFKMTRKRDIFKRDLAKLAKIPLIEVSYKYLDSGDLERYLMARLKKLGVALDVPYTS